MAEERVVTSLPEQLKAAYAKGTTASKSLKTFAGKALPVSYWVVGVLFLIGMILIFIPYIKEEARKPPVAPVAQGEVQQPRAEKKAEVTVTWVTLLPDGTIPTDVWSEPSKVPTYCNVRFPGGYGKLYTAQSQYYSSEWMDMESGKHYEMDKFRLKVLRPGTTPSTLAYTLSCR